MKQIFIPILLFIFLQSFSQINSPQKLKDSIYKQTYIEDLSPVILSGTTDIVTAKQAPLVTSTLKASNIQLFGGARDLPEYLNGFPSVYTTKGGGGIGDSHISLRGFSQRNVAVLINGVPVNDMETGWVYWSNWNHLPDITSAVQVQPGLGASKLAIPSVGGTINIMTKPASTLSQTNITYQYVSTGINKQALQYQTGILENGLSIAFRLEHFEGDAYVDMTQFEGYDYYFNVVYQPNEKHHFMFNVIGAPQWHNQHNIASKLIDYINYGTSGAPNNKYNSEWGLLNGNSYTWSRNFFHKPLASLNWDWQLKDDLQLSTVFYGAWGRGGGTGPVGAINYHYPGDPVFTNEQGQIRFDDIYTWNGGGHIADFGQDKVQNSEGLFVNDIGNGLTRYAFMNNHAWYGAIWNLSYNWSNSLTLNAGFDLRATSGKNTLTVNDVLGADAYFDFFDINYPNRLITPENFVPATYDWNPFKSIDDLDKIIFYTQSKVRWAGSYWQAKYKTESWNAFLQGSFSNQSYQKIDYFNLPSGQQASGWVNIVGGNIKSGLGYSVNKQNFLYVNAGYYSKQPLFKAVFPETGITPNNDLSNEHIYAAETGYRLNTDKWKVNLNLYYTSWQNRYELITDYYQNQQVSGTLSGIEEVHKGIELTAKAKFNAIQIENTCAIGDWYYKGNINNVVLYNNQHQAVTTQNYYLDGVKVGNAAQFTDRLTVFYKVNKDLKLFLSQFYVDKLYAKIDAASFSQPNHQGSLALPAYSLVDAGVTYKVYLKKIGQLKLNANVQNFMNKIYISESETNIFPTEQSQTWQGIDVENRVFWGWGRTFSLSLSLKL